MTWTSFTKATMQGRCSSTSKWVLTTTERKDTKSLRMRLPLIIRLTHGYWINWYLLIIDIYHRISIYISIIASLRRQMRTEQPTRTSRSRSLPRGAWWQCKPSTRYKYKCKPSTRWLSTYLYFALIWPRTNLWSDPQKNLWYVWPRPCDLTKNCLAAEPVQVEQEKAVHHRWHWCNPHGLLHVFSQVMQNLF